MNFSMYGADRATHLRIVAVALAGGIVMMAFSISARLGSIADTPTIVEAGKFRASPELVGKEAQSLRLSTQRL